MYGALASEFLAGDAAIRPASESVDRFSFTSCMFSWRYSWCRCRRSALSRSLWILQSSSPPPPLLPQSHPSILFNSGVCRFTKKIGAGTVIADVKEHSLAARGRRVNDVDRELVSGMASSEASKAAGEVAADSVDGQHPDLKPEGCTEEADSA